MIVARVISAVIVMVVTMPVTVTVAGRSPPGCIIIRSPVIAVSYPAIADTYGETPTGKGIIMYPISVSNWSRIIIPAIPRFVIISRTINNRTMIGVGINIAGRISNVHNRWCIIIHMDIFDIVNRIFRGYFLDLVRYYNTYFPGSGWRTGFKPNCIIHTIISVINQ